MRLSAQFHVPRVNISRYRQALHEKLSESLAEAAKLWLQATVTEIVPVWSGASRATFLRLASYVGYVMAFTPVSDAPDRIQMGLNNGEAVFEVDSSQSIYSFTYSTTLPHLIINEYFNANDFPEKNGHQFHLTHPGPYHFQEAGRRTFERFAESDIQLPDLTDFVDTVQLSAG